MEKLDQRNQGSQSNDVYMQAASWVAQLDSGCLSDADRIALAEWMARSPRHASELRRLAKLWGTVDQLLDEAVTPVDSSARRSVMQVVLLWFKHRPLIFSGYVGAALASFLLLSVIWVFYAQPSSPLNAMYQTEIGESRNILLTDGSTATLNTNSLIEFEYTDNFRKIRLLRGEALFEVVKDPKRPFQVYAGKSMVEAVGTAFLVRLYDEEFDVTVTEGVVQLKSASEEVDHAVNTPAEEDRSQTIAAPAVLSVGQTVRVKMDHSMPMSVAQIEPAAIEKRVAWRKGLLIFDGDSLENVVNEVARYMSKTIVITDTELGALEMSGVFRTGDLDSLLSALEASLNVEVLHAHEDIIYINKKS